ncbi:hypothetical protein HPB51_024874 [Rhipicephalus microplus]|uniref:Anoctamin n=1 Tax=Rhipicephalus microplus TaxID=6941 RepID=A0A9J6F6G0_RHIMP|nr:hypothetical protein HPB51_024874 [Rhipicephalus microplus]
MSHRIAKYCCSVGFFVMMSIVVLISVLAVTLYQVYMYNAYCNAETTCEVVHGSIVAPMLNTISIMVLGKDRCGHPGRDTCMSLLSLQLLILMIVKPFPKFCYDVLWPLLKKVLRKWGIMYRVADEKVSDQHFLLRELYKQDDPEFRRDEFAEKIIQYGYLMLFAASFPLAPLLALLYNMFDLRIDGNRLLWLNRRPVPFRDDDIGMWFHLFGFINVCGVVSNAFLIAFTSTFGRNLKSDYRRFMFVIAFEHLVFGVKFILTLAIPDTPAAVKNAKTKLSPALRGLAKPITFVNGDVNTDDAGAREAERKRRQWKTSKTDALLVKNTDHVREYRRRVGSTDETRTKEVERKCLQRVPPPVYLRFKLMFTRANATPSLSSNPSSSTRVHIRFKRVDAVRTTGASHAIRVPYGKMIHGILRRRERQLLSHMMSKVATLQDRLLGGSGATASQTGSAATTTAANGAGEATAGATQQLRRKLSLTREE